MSRILTHPERARRQAAFVVVCERHGAKTKIARAWGTCVAVVKRVRDGGSTLTDEKILALPPSLRAAVEARLAAPIQLRLPLL